MEQLYRWVKASERLPEEDKQYPCKWEDTNEPFTLRYHHKNGFSVHEDHLPKLLWLSPIEEREQDELWDDIENIFDKHTAPTGGGYEADYTDRGGFISECKKKYHLIKK